MVLTIPPQELFSGTHIMRIDEKRRFSVPAQFRELLPDEAPSLCLITENLQFKAYSARTLSTPFDETGLSAIERHLRLASDDEERLAFFGNMGWYTPDSHGRLLIPKKVDRYSIIRPGEEVHITGNGDHFKISDISR